MQLWHVSSQIHLKKVEGFCVGLHRCQAFKLCQRLQYTSARDPVTGKTTYKGNAIKHKKCS
jgi:hypothetical protein